MKQIHFNRKTTMIAVCIAVPALAIFIQKAVKAKKYKPTIGA